jgi:hypothetical protein
MKKIEKEELFGHVREFLKAKGIDLQEGSYTRTIEKGCQVLVDTINLSQQAMERAKVELERTLDQARQVIHQKTAPRKPPVQPQPEPEPTPDAPEQKEPPKSRPDRSKKKSSNPEPRTRKKPL